MKATRLNLFCLCGAGLWLGVMARAEDARALLKEGAREYAASNYVGALQRFQAAAEGAGDGQLDPGVATFNAGNALYRMQRLPEAGSNFLEAARSGDLGLQSRAYYNRGNTLLAQAAAGQQQGQLDQAGQVVDEAVRMYENALALDPKDLDTKVNYELAVKKQEEIQQQQEQQKQQEKNQDEQEKDEQKDQDKPQPQDQEKKEDQEKQDQEQQNQAQQDQQNDQQNQQPQPQPEKKSEEMTPEEAQMVLDAMKNEEQARRDQLRHFLGQPMPVDKDW